MSMRRTRSPSTPSRAVAVAVGARRDHACATRCTAVLCLILTLLLQPPASGCCCRPSSSAIVLVLVYVGAVMVLFLFVVMMLDINIAPAARRLRALRCRSASGRGGGDAGRDAGADRRVKARSAGAVRPRERGRRGASPTPPWLGAALFTKFMLPVRDRRGDPDRRDRGRAVMLTLRRRAGTEDAGSRPRQVTVRARGPRAHREDEAARSHAAERGGQP